MKKSIRNIAILIAPVLLMVAMNETVRPTIQDKAFNDSVYTGMNARQKIEDYCTWNCHFNTRYCMDHHVKYLRPYFNITDTVYYGMINWLRIPGDYIWANIVFMVILIPFLIWFFIIKSLNIQDKIKRLKKSQ
ncbi:hypothetical protein [Saccharicrinis sp. 156]|uniref:hypothetical protein n=1 Tax=Saccharicrinis sp. 156 TaxID=3417574 RepID=UPI003D326AE6